MRSVLTLTAGFGEGHNAAAKGLKEGFDAVGQLHNSVLDPFVPAFGRLYQWLRARHLRVVNQRPQNWARTYAILDKHPFVDRLFGLLFPLKKELQRLLTQYKPDAVISVFPIYGHLIRSAAKRAGMPHLKHYVLITDSITINGAWHRCGADAFLVPNEETADILFAAGIERSRVECLGFPVSPKFSEPFPEPPAPGASASPRILYMVNGQPERAIPLAERILREGRFELTVTVGRNQALAEALQSMARLQNKPLKVLGWVEDMPRLLREHHLLLGKAGGATVQEALAARLPILLTQILPGQEEGNARLLTQNGCGAHTPTNESVLEVLQQLFSHEAAGWKRMRRHASVHGRPDAARAVARWVAEQLEAAPQQRTPFGIRPDLYSPEARGTQLR